MTGLERLRKLVDGMAEWSVFAVMKREWCERHGVTVIDGRMAMKDLLSEIVDQIERETAHDHSKDVSMSAYDLLPEEDRKAIAWVRGHGGIDELGKRLMPAGMEWPRFDDWEPVRPGDEFADGLGGTRVCTSVEFLACEEGVRDVLIHWDGDDPDNALLVCMASGERVKRPAPKVLDADGVEIRVGDTVCGTRDMEPMRVVDTDSRECGFKRIKCEKEGDGFFFYCADELTHNLPVLAADGKPLRVGDEVWPKYPSGRDDEQVIRAIVLTLLGDGRVEVESEYPTGAKFHEYVQSDQLTHERPDSWERLEDDADALLKAESNGKGSYNAANDYCNAHGLGTDGTVWVLVAQDLVRRAKKLAGIS